MKYYKLFREQADIVLANRDCFKVIDKLPNDYVQLIVTSPPYFIGKEYDTSTSLEDFEELHANLFTKVLPKLKNGGSLCWQVGYYIQDNAIMPLDYLIMKHISKFDDIFLRNRIMWTFGHGLHSKKRFSGRHEMILWFTKGNDYKFNLDPVRVPQKYPGKRHYKGEKKGEFSGNPLGKNPSDVWNIPNVKANHVEKTNHPCQFPISLVERLILALTDPQDVVLDPFMGVGSSGACAVMNSRKFIGCEIDKDYYQTAVERCTLASKNELKYREDKPIYIPSPGSSVAKKPSSFKF